MWGRKDTLDSFWEVWYNGPFCWYAKSRSSLPPKAVLVWKKLGNQNIDGMYFGPWAVDGLLCKRICPPMCVFLPNGKLELAFRPTVYPHIIPFAGMGCTPELVWQWRKGGTDRWLTQRASKNIKSAKENLREGIRQNGGNSTTSPFPHFPRP